MAGSVVSVLKDVKAEDIGYLLGIIHKAPELTGAQSLIECLYKIII
jgi:hypothetical protein